MNLRHRVFRATVLASVVLAGCSLAGGSGVKNLSFPNPPGPAPGAPVDTTQVPPDLTGVSLIPVSSVPPTAVAVTPGGSALAGIVTGPGGVVPGATVLIERLVGDSVGSKTVATGPDGTWKLAGIRGGRYRVRAWHVPDLTLITPQITLLGAAESQSLALALMPYNGNSATATVVPALAVAQVSVLVVLVTVQAVGSDGVVRAAPLAGATVGVTAGPNIVIAGTNPGVTDAAGKLTLQLGCAAVGPSGLAATVVNVGTFPLTVPDCVAAPPPTVAPPTATTVKPPTSSSVP